MTDEEFAVYRDERYTKIMAYYDDRAKTNKFWYRVCSIYVLTTSIAITPILVLIASPLIRIKGMALDGKMIAAILAPTVALITSVVAHCRFYDNWLSYRSVWDVLQHEVHWRDAKVGEYHDSNDRNALFVERVENLISSEGVEWLARHANKDEIDRHKGKSV